MRLNCYYRSRGNNNPAYITPICERLSQWPGNTLVCQGNHCYWAAFTVGHTLLYCGSHGNHCHGFVCSLQGSGCSWTDCPAPSIS